MKDSLVLVKQACRPHGLRGASVQVDFRGAIVPVSDEHFEAALDLDVQPGQRITVGEDEREAVRAALVICSLKGRQVEAIRQGARGGSAGAERAYHAVVLCQLVRMRRQSRELAEAALSGDAEAKRAVVEVLEMATGKRRAASKSQRAQAHLSACLLRDAVSDVKGGGGANEPVRRATATDDNVSTTKPREPEPSSATVVEGIAFDSRGFPVDNPSVVSPTAPATGPKVGVAADGGAVPVAVAVGETSGGGARCEAAPPERCQVRCGG